VSPPALLLVGHGTRDPEGVAEFHAFVELVRSRAEGSPVAGGFIELSPPPLLAAAAELVRGGAREIVVVPLMLLAARHTKNDVPALVARARRAHPAVRFRDARHLGTHPTVLGLLRERLAAAGAGTGTTVLLVGRGSSDPAANADVFKLGRLLHEGSRHDGVEVCFAGITGPGIDEGLERCRRLGARRILVLPYLLFAGVLLRRIHRRAEAFARRTGVEVRVARHLGPDERLAGLVLGSYGEVVGRRGGA